MNIEIDTVAANNAMGQILQALITAKKHHPNCPHVHALYEALRDGRDTLYAAAKGSGTVQPLSGGDCAPGSC